MSKTTRLWLVLCRKFQNAQQLVPSLGQRVISVHETTEDVKYLQEEVCGFLADGWSEFSVQCSLPACSNTWQCAAGCDLARNTAPPAAYSAIHLTAIAWSHKGLQHPHKTFMAMIQGVPRTILKAAGTTDAINVQIKNVKNVKKWKNKKMFVNVWQKTTKICHQSNYYLHTLSHVANTNNCLHKWGQQICVTSAIFSK